MAYIKLVKLTSDGPEIETVNCYGASNRNESPHYDDQMQLFVEQKTKVMTLNKSWFIKRLNGFIIRNRPD